MNRHGHGSPDRGARTKRDVHRTEDLLVLEHLAAQPCAVVGAHAELGQVGAVLPVRPEPLQILGAEPALGVYYVSALYLERRRLLADPQRRETRYDDAPVTRQRRAESLATGQIPEGARSP